jgi:hypothetical protein
MIENEQPPEGRSEGMTARDEPRLKALVFLRGRSGSARGDCFYFILCLSV